MKKIGSLNDNEDKNDESNYIFDGCTALKYATFISDHYWELIQRCLVNDPKKRPSFAEITDLLKSDDKYALEEFGMKTNIDELHDYQICDVKSTCFFYWRIKTSRSMQHIMLSRCIYTKSYYIKSLPNPS